MKSPAFQFYADDFIGGTCHFSAAEVGAYIRLLCHQWGNGEIPADHERLERIAGGPVTEEVLAKFPNRKNEKMEKVRAASEKFRAACADAGRRGGGNPNFEKGKPNPYKGQDKGSINGSDKGRINSPISDLRSPSPLSDLQTPSPSPSDQKNIPQRKRGARRASPPLECVAFTEFWQQYPRKEGIAQAEAAWVKFDCAAKLPLILTKIREFKPRWLTGEPQYIPLPATWLNRRGWEDELLNHKQIETQEKDDQYKQKYGW